MCVVSSFVVGSPDGAVSFSLNAPRPMHLSFLVSSSFVYVTFSSLPTVFSSFFFHGIRWGVGHAGYDDARTCDRDSSILPFPHRGIYRLLKEYRGKGNSR